MLSVHSLVRKYEEADPGSVWDGELWYPLAWKTCKRMAQLAPEGAGPQRVAGVVAAISPRTRWQPNVEMADAACRAALRTATKGRKAQAYAVRSACSQAFPRRRELAVKILVDGVHPQDLNMGPKCDAFWRAIVGDTTQVVVDAWTARAVGLNPERLTPTRIRTAADRITLAAQEVEQTPRDLQAILWVVERGEAD